MVAYITSCVVLFHNTTPIHCTPPPTAPPFDDYPAEVHTAASLKQGPFGRMKTYPESGVYQRGAELRPGGAVPGTGWGILGVSRFGPGFGIYIYIYIYIYI